jgi:hypothetical protein
MAITIIKQPALFFNCTNPAIFEFTTDSVAGNFEDYVCDVVINSQYATKSAIIRNIFPNTKTKIFSVDISDFLKSLQLNNFEFEFDKSKNLSIEKFGISLKVRDSFMLDDEDFSFGNYIFDNFVFTDSLNVIDTNSDSFIFSILGERLLFDKSNNFLVQDKLTFLTPECIEVCNRFSNYISIFNNELSGQTVSVSEINGNISYQKGVSTYLLNSTQLSKIKSKTEITCSNQNQNVKLFALPFNFSACDKIVQFRFYNQKGGYSFFYAVLDSQSEDRSKVNFYERSYLNENENKSYAVQSNSDYKNELKFKGSKNIALKELFQFLLRSPKVEMNLKELNGNDFFIECEVTGISADQYLTFDYSLTAKITNSGNFKL